MVATREQMYGLIDAFERDMREVFDRFVLTEVAEAEAVGDGYEEASSRRTLEGDPSSPIVQFLDLRPTYDLLNRHRDLLPAALAAELRELTPELDVIVPIRRRIAHARPLVAGDPERIVSALNKFATRWWVNTASALAALRASADWVPDDLPPVRPDEVGHNLPLPEYDETGLLGRDEEVKMLANALKRGRDAVVTLAARAGSARPRWPSKSPTTCSTTRTSRSRSSSGRPSRPSGSPAPVSSCCAERRTPSSGQRMRSDRDSAGTSRAASRRWVRRSRASGRWW